jgi:hypothetical protein
MDLPDPDPEYKVNLNNPCAIFRNVEYILPYLPSLHGHTALVMGLG